MIINNSQQDILKNFDGKVEDVLRQKKKAQRFVYKKQQAEHNDLHKQLF